MPNRNKRKKRKREGRDKKRIVEPRKALILPSSQILRPMSPHERRMHELGAKFLPPPWYPEAELIYAYLERQARIDVGTRVKAKQIWRRMRHWHFAQLHSGSGFLMATWLRWCVQEYADRMIRHGPHALPCSFNIVEAFLRYDNTSLLFGLRQEREHLLDAREYFDWYSSNDLPRDPSLLIDVMEEGVVYSFDLSSANSGYRVTGENSMFVMAGASFVRHQDELSCVLVAGEQPPLHSDEEAASMLDSGGAVAIPKGKEGIEPDPTLSIEDRYLEAYPGFSRVIVLTRFDLVARKHDVRYFALDIGPAFNILTDDATIELGLPQDHRPKSSDPPPPFNRYDQLFSALAASIYLPLALVAMSEHVQELQFATELGSRASDKQVKDAIRELGSEKCPLYRTVRCLATRTAPTAEIEKTIDPPNLEFRKDGFWKPLVPGQVGEDKDGNQIIGRTWVTRHESWTASNPSSFLLTKSPCPRGGRDPGIVYIIRSPGHELNMHKIGLTRRTADVRAGELSSATGVPLPFGVLASWEVGDCAAVEKECHTRLQAMRVNPNREFFHGRLQQITAEINQIVEELASSS